MPHYTYQRHECEKYKQCIRMAGHKHYKDWDNAYRNKGFKWMERKSGPWRGVVREVVCPSTTGQRAHPLKQGQALKIVDVFSEEL